MTIWIDPVSSHAMEMPHRLAVGDIETGHRWTWADLDRAADRAASWLAERLGPASGARVAVLARNHPLQVVLQFACARAGAIFVPLNWRLTSAELGDILDDADPALLFHDLEFVVPPHAAARFALSDLETLGQSGDRAAATARRDWDAPMTLLYTSGTSGKPKGVIVTEANAFWGNINFTLGSQVDRDSIFLCDLPMFHTAGLFAAIRAPILVGGKVWISAGFDVAETIARLADPDLGITHYFAVPQMAAAMWQHPDFAPAKLARLRTLISGGAPNPRAQAERFIRAGIPMSDGFGMSETGSNFGMPVGDSNRMLAKAGSCGLPFLTVQTRIVDQHGRDVAPGEAGELWIRGPSVTPGYWNRPDLSATAFQDGWFKSGDIGRRDADGFLYLMDRRKDMFISGGENVYPAEVEATLSELEDIAAVAVIGVPDERWGEVGRAFVILKPGCTLDGETILTHCRARLARYKVPATLILTDSLPCTASGKVKKHLLPRS